MNEKVLNSPVTIDRIHKIKTFLPLGELIDPRHNRLNLSDY